MAAPPRIVWSPAAVRQLEEALAYLSEQSVLAATTLLEETLAAAGSLTSMAERGREVPELRDGRTRELLVQKYRLMYEVSAETVELVGFVHGARDFHRWQRGD